MKGDAYDVLKTCIETGKVLLSPHAVMQMISRNLDIQHTVNAAKAGTMVKSYQGTRGEPRLLVRQAGEQKRHVYTVWDLPLDADGEAELVTAYEAPLKH